MDSVTHHGTVHRSGNCACGAARLNVMVPAGSFTWDAGRPKGISQAHMPEMRPMDRPLDVFVCTRCDGGTADDIDLNTKGTHS